MVGMLQEVASNPLPLRCFGMGLILALLNKELNRRKLKVVLDQHLPDFHP